MPNVTWQEPQILLDLLAVNLFAELNGLTLPGAGTSRSLLRGSPTSSCSCGHVRGISN